MNEISGCSRRQFVQGASVFAAAGLIAGRREAWAKAPPALPQPAAIYRFKIGTMDAIAISDGPLVLGQPTQSILGPREEIDRMLAENLLPTDQWMVAQNALVVINGDRVVLIDTGMGDSQLFGNMGGRLLANLRAAGIGPDTVDDVVISHAHADHCWALMGKDGKPNFPNARIHIAQRDFEFWTDPATAAQADFLKPFIEATRAQLLPLRERLSFIRDGQEVVPGIQAIAAPGHTVGHTVFVLTSGGQTLCNLADVTHHHVISLERPRFEFAYDTDRQQAVATRLRMLDMLAVNRIQFIGYHFPFPGIGHVVKHGDAFRYVPTAMNTARL
jgi:glyoxylase-like metal-dependent hydrolase (beta-lactamase superfamily II)